MDSLTKIIVKCSNCGKIIIEKIVMDRMPVEDDYRNINSIEIKVRHQSSLGTTSDLCCSVECASEFVKTFDIN